MFRESVKRMKRAAMRSAVGAAAAVGLLEVTTHLPSQGRSSEFYHRVSDEGVTPLLRRFTGPELAHRIAIDTARRGWAPQHRPSAAEQRVSVASTVFGRHFPNPVGLAAGFDKDAEVVRPMLQLGFGFVEVGTVTPLPQPGNPSPRVFRLPRDLGIINRYGFNSKGADAVEANLKEYRKITTTSDDNMQQNNDGAGDDRATSSSAVRALTGVWQWLYPTPPDVGLVGVNIGKNKSSEDAAADYVSGIRRLAPLADFVVINVSSPNTAGLRDLQRTAPLRNLLTQCLDARDALAEAAAEPPVPLLVKLAPDLLDDDLRAIGRTCLEVGIDGIVVSNTTTQRPDDLISKHHAEIGGLSGAPIKDRSTECIRKVYEYTDGRIPIVGVGGVGSGQDAFDKFKAGASLVEVYSMMVYKGPGVVSRIRNELAQLMIDNGTRSIEDVVGMDHEDIFWRRREETKLLNRRMESRTIVLEPLQR